MDHKRLGRGLQSLLPTGSASGNPSATVGVDLLSPNPRQPRETFEDAALERLADSIKKNGILQPIVVRRQDSGFEIVAGERRWRAAMRAGLREVPVVIRDNVGEIELLELALLENVQRVDLNPIEKAKGYRRLIEEFNKTQEDVATSVGQERATISNLLRLLDLPPDIQLAVQRDAISSGHARALLSIPDSVRRHAVFERVLRDNLSVREVERIAAEEGAKKKTDSRRRKSALPAWVAEIEDRWRRRLGVRIELKLQGQRAQIAILCANLDELERVTDLAVGLPNTSQKTPGS